MDFCLVWVLPPSGAGCMWSAKWCLDVIPPFALLAIRLILGTLTLGIGDLPCAKSKVVITRALFWQSLLVGFVGYGISLGFQFVGTKLSTASNGSLVTSATPAFVLLFAPYLLGEKTTLRKLIALVIATLGVMAVIDPRKAELSPILFWGNMSLLAAALTWALYSVLVRKVSQIERLAHIERIDVSGRCAVQSVDWDCGSSTPKALARSPGELLADCSFWDHLDCHRDVPVELCLRHITCRSRIANVFRPTGCRYFARLVLSWRKNHAALFIGRRVDRGRDFDFSKRELIVRAQLLNEHQFSPTVCNNAMFGGRTAPTGNPHTNTT